MDYKKLDSKENRSDYTVKEGSIELKITKEELNSMIWDLTSYCYLIETRSAKDELGFGGGRGRDGWIYGDWDY